MAYLGNDLQVAFPVYRNIDDISGSFNSSTTSFPLRVSGVAPVPAPLYSQQCLISVGGVVQRPDDTGSEGFRLSGGNIIFASAPTTGADFFGVILAGADYINAGGNFPSGTAAVPSITFNDDLDTGIYNSGINQVSITTGGSERLRIDSAGQIESVSLGTAAAPAFSFTTDPNSGIYSPGADQVAISTGGTRRLDINSSGQFRIGDGGTVGVFSAKAATNANLHIRDIAAVTGSGTGVAIDVLNDAVTAVQDIAIRGTTTIFRNNSGESLRITSAGLVGVGTSSPSWPLDVNGVVRSTGTSAMLALSDRSTGTGDRYGIYSNSNTLRVYDFTAAADRVVVDSSGRVGVGTTSPSFNLDVTGTFRSTGEGRFDNGINLKTATLNYVYFDDALAFTRNGTGERLRIDSSGRVGIGTSSPGAGLHVANVPIWAGATTASTSGVIAMYGDGNNGTIEAFAGNNSSTKRNICLAPYGGSVGIGTTSPVVEFEVRKNYAGPTTIKIGNTDTGGSSGSVIQLENGTAGVDLTNISTSKAGSFFALQGFGSINTSYLDFNTHIFRNQGGSTEYARIDSSGRLLVGTSTSTAVNEGEEPFLQVKGTDSRGGVSLIRYSNDGASCGLYIGKSRGTSIGSNTVVQNNDEIGRVTFSAADGTDLNTVAAGIFAFVDGTPGANDMPGRLVFSTCGDGASSPTERMRIGQAGQATFTTTTSTPAIFVTNTDGAYADTINTWRSARAANTAYNFLLAQSNAGLDNEFALRGDGNGLCDGAWTGGGADYAEYFEWIDSNATAEDRRGISVVLDGDKIRQAVAGEDPIGVISGNPSVVGDAAWNKWSGKYLRDEFGTYILDANGDRQLNPDYDPDAEYIPREERPEWDCVGLMGKLRIRKGQVTGSRWIKMRDINDSVEEWLVR